jgi:hypothetical protein
MHFIILFHPFCNLIDFKIILYLSFLNGIPLLAITQKYHKKPIRSKENNILGPPNVSL